MGANNGFFAGVVPGFIKKQQDAGTDATKFAATAAIASTDKAIADQQTKSDAAAQALKDAQSTASSQASATLRQRSAGATQTVYTSPLGLSTQAGTARKKLLGD